MNMKFIFFIGIYWVIFLRFGFFLFGIKRDGGLLLWLADGWIILVRISLDMVLYLEFLDFFWFILLFIIGNIFL